MSGDYIVLAGFGLALCASAMIGHTPGNATPSPGIKNREGMCVKTWIKPNACQLVSLKGGICNYQPWRVLS